MTSAFHQLYQRAERVLPGGVTAAARANAALGHPFYVERAEGPYVVAADGRRYLDLCMSNGATLLGHGHPAIVAALRRAGDLGFACGYDGEAQVRLAERLVEQIPAFEAVRFTTSGTEATFYAVRIARAATGRSGVLKFEGHFHGFNDALAFSFWPPVREAGPAEAPHTYAETAGLPPGTAEQVIVAPFNDPAAFRRAMDEHGDRLAAVILEPINYDVGAILPDRAFLALLRAETARRGIVLIFDEILSGYRTGPSGAQGYLGVTPDLATLGKALGGGLPLSAFGGRRALMDVVAPRGPAVHTGTYNAHLLPILAAHGFLDTIAEAGFYDRLLARHARLYAGLRAAFAAAGLPVRVQGVGARFGLYFGLDPDREVTNYREAAQADKALLPAFCREMHARGVYVAPAWHHGLCALHTDALVDQVVALAEDSARAVVARPGSKQG
jgi:glutamate-1-semialdehyde 2,1-aminomutase